MTGASLGRAAYPLTLAALPRHGDLLAAKRPPVSRIGLDKRLALLPPADQAEIAAIEGLLSWERAQRFGSDAALLAHADAVLAGVRDGVVRTLVAERFALRSIVAALRLRRAGRPAPGPRETWGRTDLAWRIARNWAAPGFGLGPAQAWVRRVEAAMEADDPAAVEREILSVVWRSLDRAAMRHPAGYRAVVIYVLRWSVIDRWTRQDPEAARLRFRAWVADAAAAALGRQPAAGQGAVR